MYEVIDWYEGKEILGIVNTRKEASALAKERVADTDGECDIEVRKIDKEGEK